MSTPYTRKSGILALAAPLVISFWLRSAFAWADAAFAATLENGDAALAAIGLAMPFEFLLIACWVGSSNGLTARLAAAMGAHEGARIEQLKHATRRIVLTLIAVFIGLALLIWFGAGWFSDDPAVVHSFRIYGSVLTAGSACTSFWSILPDSLIKAHHDTRATMWAGVLSSVLNLGLNALFVFVVGWGIFGIALSTVLGRLAGYIYAAHKARQHEARRLQINQDKRPGKYARPVRAILTIAVPAGLTFALLALELLAINALIGRTSEPTANLAAFSLFDRAARFMAMPPIACGVALLPLSARMWSTGDSQGITRAMGALRRAGIIYLGLVLAPLAWLVGPTAAAALTDSTRACEAATLGMYWVPLSVVASAPMLVQRSALEGMGQPGPGLLVSFTRTFLLVIPLSYLGLEFAPSLGWETLNGAFAGATLGTGIASFWITLWTRRSLARMP